VAVEWWTKRSTTRQQLSPEHRIAIRLDRPAAAFGKTDSPDHFQVRIAVILVLYPVLVLFHTVIIAWTTQEVKEVLVKTVTLR